MVDERTILLLFIVVSAGIQVEAKPNQTMAGQNDVHKKPPSFQTQIFSMYINSTSHAKKP